jgi:hypothetical protein
MTLLISVPGASLSAGLAVSLLNRASKFNAKLYPRVFEDVKEKHGMHSPTLRGIKKLSIQAPCILSVASNLKQSTSMRVYYPMKNLMKSKRGSEENIPNPFC